jgi:hypothetical protein
LMRFQTNCFQCLPCKAQKLDSVPQSSMMALRNCANSRMSKRTIPLISDTDLIANRDRFVEIAIIFLLHASCYF